MPLKVAQLRNHNKKILTSFKTNILAIHRYLNNIITSSFNFNASRQVAIFLNLKSNKNEFLLPTYNIKGKISDSQNSSSNLMDDATYKHAAYQQPMQFHKKFPKSPSYWLYGKDYKSTQHSTNHITTHYPSCMVPMVSRKPQSYPGHKFVPENSSFKAQSKNIADQSISASKNNSYSYIKYQKQNLFNQTNLKKHMYELLIYYSSLNELNKKNQKYKNQLYNNQVNLKIILVYSYRFLLIKITQHKLSLLS